MKSVIIIPARLAASRFPNKPMALINNIPMIVPDKNSDVKNAIVFLHGYGANGKDLISIGHEWKDKLKNTIFISPNAPFNCDWGGDAYQWFDLTSTAPEKIGEGLEKAGPFLNKFIIFNIFFSIFS